MSATFQYSPALAIEFLAEVFQHCEDVNSCPADMWLELDRGRVLLEHTDRGVIEKVRKTVAFLGGSSRPIEQRQVWRYRIEGGGWTITELRRDDQPARSYITYRTVFLLSRRILIAVMSDPDEMTTAV